MSRPLRLAVLVFAAAFATLLPAGCSPSTSTRPVTSVPLATAAAPGLVAAAVPARTAVGVCAGVTGCRVVASVDVDGDGRADQVGVSSSRLGDDGSITVRVRTATVHTMQTTGRHVYWYGRPFLGVAPLDGRAGAEIVVGSTMGANYEEFRVITYRAGRLVTLEAPPLVWTKAGMTKATPRWGIDGSYSFHTGVHRHVAANGEVRVTTKTADRNESGHGFTGHTNVYRWHAGHWQKVSAKAVRYPSDRSVTGVGGWHVRGLPAFAE